MATSLLNQSRARGEFFRRLAEVQPWWDRLALTLPSNDAATTVLAFTGSAPRARKLRGGPRQTKALQGVRINIAKEAYTSGINIAYEDMRRDQTGEVNRKMGDLATRMRQIIANELTTLIANGNGTTSGTAYDGANFFSASHSFGSSGTQRNLYTASEITSLNVTTAAAPTPEEAERVAMDIISNMYGYKDDEGEPLNEDAKSWVIMVSPNLYGAFWTAVNANMLNNRTSALNQLVERGVSDISVAMNPRLTTTDVVYVFRGDATSFPPLVMEEEMPVRVDFKDEGSEFFQDNFEIEANAKWIGGFAFGEPLCASRSTLS
jgi:hypothetical protein